MASLNAYASIAVLTAGLSATFALAQQPRPLGVWIDHTGRGAVEITDCNGALCGHVVWVKDPKNTKACRTQILGNVRHVGGNTWDRGWIVDPEDKTPYAVELRTVGDRLQVLGYVGSKLFGETMMWTRAPADIKRCDGKETITPMISATAPKAAAAPATPPAPPAKVVPTLPPVPPVTAAPMLLPVPPADAVPVPAPSPPPATLRQPAQQTDMVETAPASVIPPQGPLARPAIVAQAPPPAVTPRTINPMAKPSAAPPAPVTETTARNPAAARTANESRSARKPPATPTSPVVDRPGQKPLVVVAPPVSDRQRQQHAKDRRRAFSPSCRLELPYMVLTFPCEAVTMIEPELAAHTRSNGRRQSQVR